MHGSASEIRVVTSSSAHNPARREPTYLHVTSCLLAKFASQSYISPTTVMSTLPPISSLLSQPQFDLPNFKANFNKALTSISVPRLFAAVTTKAEAPNPLLHVYNGKSDIGLPISPEQTELLRGRGILRRDARMGVDMIRMEELAIRNLAWKIWAQDQGKALVAEKFGIADVMVYFEFAFVSDGQAGDWGKE
jgi:hypothetical protein